MSSAYWAIVLLGFLKKETKNNHKAKNTRVLNHMIGGKKVYMSPLATNKTMALIMRVKYPSLWIKDINLFSLVIALDFNEFSQRRIQPQY
jgi:hypothetical protein